MGRKSKNDSMVEDEDLVHKRKKVEELISFITLNVENYLYPGLTMVNVFLILLFFGIILVCIGQILYLFDNNLDDNTRNVFITGLCIIIIILILLILNMIYAMIKFYSKKAKENEEHRRRMKRMNEENE